MNKSTLKAPSAQAMATEWLTLTLLHDRDSCILNALNSKVLQNEMISEGLA